MYITTFCLYRCSVTFPDAARMGDGDAASSSDSDVDGDFVVRKKIPAKKTPVAKVVQVDSESGGSDPFEYCDKTRSKKKSQDHEVNPDVVSVHVDGVYRDEDEFFCSPDEEQQKLLESLEGVELEKIDLPPEVADAIGFDPDKEIAFVECE